MKKQSYLFIAIWGILTSSLLSGCQGEDRRIEYQDVRNVNNWIYTQMKSVYLWNDKVPNEDKLNFYTPPTPFFTSLLSSNESKNGHYYSYIEDNNAVVTKSIDSNSSYGFEFAIYPNDVNEMARVLYVLPNSPASIAGIKRGDWITKINDAPIIQDNEKLLLNGGSVKLSTATVKVVDNKNIITPGSDITIGAAQAVNDKPILAKNVLTSKAGTKVGYLIYNHFSMGINDAIGDFSYETELRKTFAEFKQANVTDFVLDLRYNHGGLVSNSQLLATMLAPQGALSKIFCTIKYNSSATKPKEDCLFDNSLIKEGANLNLSKLYVLVSSQTASASELIINGLTPFIPVVIIGTKTEGKNLASLTIESSKYRLVLHPIVGQLYNSKNESNYSAGFTPDITLDEMSDFTTFEQFGSANELLLKKAMAVINGEIVIPPKPATKAMDSVIRKSSLDRKKMNGALVGPVHIR